MNPLCHLLSFSGFSLNRPRIRAGVRTGLAILLAGLGACSHVPIEPPVQARYWTDPSGWVDFPERDPEGPVWGDLRGRADFGIAFSGGGTRSAAATVGQLRGLREIGLLDRVRYVSAVSGGAWAAVPYTYLAEERREAFLEGYCAPESLTVDDFSPGEGSMTAALAEAYVTGEALSHLARLRGSEAFARTVAARFLAPFGLGDAESWFTWSEASARDALRRNPGLPARYHTVPAGRPYLIVGGTIRHFDLFPWNWEETTGAKRIPVVFTPLYSGVRRFVEANGHAPHPIGGGYVESFAYDSIGAVKAGPKLARASLYRRGLWQTAPLLTLGDVIGSSGAAPGEVSLAVELFGLPKYNHWSPRTLETEGRAEGDRYAQQDGGHSENLGIIPLLSRRVGRIVAFVNAQSKVVKKPDGTTEFPDYVRALFDVKVESKYVGSNVFRKEALDELDGKLWASVDRGGPAVATLDLEVLPNERYGVEGGWTVKVCWIFLDAEQVKKDRRASQNWIDQVPCGSPARDLLETSKRLKSFPNYGTFFENKGLRMWDVIRLYPEQATALAHYGAWTVAASEAEIKSLFAK